MQRGTDGILVQRIVMNDFGSAFQRSHRFDFVDHPFAHIHRIAVCILHITADAPIKCRSRGARGRLEGIGNCIVIIVGHASHAGLDLNGLADTVIHIFQQECGIFGSGIFPDHGHGTDLFRIVIGKRGGIDFHHAIGQDHRSFRAGNFAAEDLIPVDLLCKDFPLQKLIALEVGFQIDRVTDRGGITGIDRIHNDRRPFAVSGRIIPDPVSQHETDIGLTDVVPGEDQALVCACRGSETGQRSILDPIHIQVLIDGIFRQIVALCISDTHFPARQDFAGLQELTGIDHDFALCGLCHIKSTGSGIAFHIIVNNIFFHAADGKFVLPFQIAGGIFQIRLQKTDGTFILVIFDGVPVAGDVITGTIGLTDTPDNGLVGIDIFQCQGDTRRITGDFTHDRVGLRAVRIEDVIFKLINSLGNINAVVIPGEGDRIVFAIVPLTQVVDVNVEGGDVIGFAIGRIGQSHLIRESIHHDRPITVDTFGMCLEDDFAAIGVIHHADIVAQFGTAGTGCAIIAADLRSEVVFTEFITDQLTGADDPVSVIIIIPDFRHDIIAQIQRFHAHAVVFQVNRSDLGTEIHRHVISVKLEQSVFFGTGPIHYNIVQRDRIEVRGLVIQTAFDDRFPVIIFVIIGIQNLVIQVEHHVQVSCADGNRRIFQTGVGVQDQHIVTGCELDISFCISTGSEFQTVAVTCVGSSRIRGGLTIYIGKHIVFVIALGAVFERLGESTVCIHFITGNDLTGDTQIIVTAFQVGLTPADTVKGTVNITDDVKWIPYFICNEIIVLQVLNGNRDPGIQYPERLSIDHLKTSRGLQDIIPGKCICDECISFHAVISIGIMFGCGSRIFQSRFRHLFQHVLVPVAGIADHIHIGSKQTAFHGNCGCCDPGGVDVCHTVEFTLFGSILFRCIIIHGINDLTGHGVTVDHGVDTDKHVTPEVTVDRDIGTPDTVGFRLDPQTVDRIILRDHAIDQISIIPEFTFKSFTVVDPVIFLILYIVLVFIQNNIVPGRMKFDPVIRFRVKGVEHLEFFAGEVLFRVDTAIGRIHKVFRHRVDIIRGAGFFSLDEISGTVGDSPVRSIDFDIDLIKAFAVHISGGAGIRIHAGILIMEFSHFFHIGQICSEGRGSYCHAAVLPDLHFIFIIRICADSIRIHGIRAAGVQTGNITVDGTAVGSFHRKSIRRIDPDGRCNVIRETGNTGFPFCNRTGVFSLCDFSIQRDVVDCGIDRAAFRHIAQDDIRGRKTFRKIFVI